MSKMTRSAYAQKQRKCRAKEKFKTVQDAAIRMASALMHNKLKLNIYECEFCGNYHLTSREQTS